jgi:hypothetical protein
MAWQASGGAVKAGWDGFMAFAFDVSGTVLPGLKNCRLDNPKGGD